MGRRAWPADASCQYILGKRKDTSSDIHTRTCTINIHDNAWDLLSPSLSHTHGMTTINLSKHIYIRHRHTRPGREDPKIPSAWHYHPATSGGSLVRVEIMAQPPREMAS